MAGPRCKDVVSAVVRRWEGKIRERVRLETALKLAYELAGAKRVQRVAIVITDALPRALVRYESDLTTRLVEVAGMFSTYLQVLRQSLAALQQLLLTQVVRRIKRHPTSSSTTATTAQNPPARLSTSLGLLRSLLIGAALAPAKIDARNQAASATLLVPTTRTRRRMGRCAFQENLTGHFNNRPPTCHPRTLKSRARPTVQGGPVPIFGPSKGLRPPGKRHL